MLHTAQADGVAPLVDVIGVEALAQMVADRRNRRIQKFTSDGAFITKWGAEGKNHGEFTTLLGVAVAPDGSAYVADGFNHRIEKFALVP